MSNKLHPLHYVLFQLLVAVLFMAFIAAPASADSPKHPFFPQDITSAPLLAPVKQVTPITPTLSITTCSNIIPGSEDPNDVTCGYVTVPEDHFSLTNTKTLSLAVAVYKTTGTSPVTDALFILHGGPASSILKVLALGGEFFYVSPFRNDRDVVVFDQRGTGSSIPNLYCAEGFASTLEAIGQTLTDQQAIDKDNAAGLACRTRILNEGHNLNNYNSLQNAADVETIRQALVNDGLIHSDKINLYGISYGTRLALTILREWSANHLSPVQTGSESNVRSVIIEGVYPPEMSGYERPNAITRSLKLMFDECKANVDCNRAYPNLENVFIELANKYKTTPLAYTFTYNSQVYNGLVTQSDFVDKVVGNMLDFTSVAQVPALIYAIKNGDTSVLTSAPSPELIDRATYFSIVCPEDLLRVTTAQYDTMFNALQTNFPYLVSSAYRSNISSPRMTELCTQWGIPLVSSAMRQRVTSSVPTLVVEGNYDINTPPVWGQSALQGLTYGQYIEIPNLAHAGATFQEESLNLLYSFLAAPSTKLAQADVDKLKTLSVQWSLPKVAATFSPVTCSNIIPGSENPDDVMCGYVPVPVDHFSVTNTKTISIAVAVYKTTGTSPVTDALFILHGGPASSILKVLALGGEFFYVSPFRNDRDVVVFDQRGTGSSIPNLYCAEGFTSTLEAIGQTLTDQQAIDKDNAAGLACRTRLLNEGHDLSKYNSLQNAADVEQIRQALVNNGLIHSDKINLYGISYGTRLALTILREWSANYLSPRRTGYESNVRSVIIEGVYPPEISGYVRPNSITRSLKLMFDECKANVDCNRAYPNLENVFIELANKYKTTPLTYTFTYNSQVYNGLVTQSDFVDKIVGNMLDFTSVSQVPALIYKIKNGDTSVLTSAPSPELIDRATYFSIVCPEDLLRVTPAEYDTMFAALQAKHPYLVSSAYRSNISSPRMSDLCGKWGIPLVSPAMRQRVTSSVPTLVVEGNYDINTPPEWGQSALQGLSNGQYIEIPNLAHAGATFQDDSLNLLYTFLAAPSTKLAQTDVDKLKSLSVQWSLPAYTYLPVMLQGK